MTRPGLDSRVLAPVDAAALDSLEALWAQRGTSVRFLWTPVDGLDAWVLNVLAPRGHIFWSLARYRGFDGGHARFLSGLGTPATLGRALQRFFDAHGIASPSFATEVVFGGLTAGLGTRFMMRERDDDYFLLAERHLCVALPTARKTAVARYFEQQLETFGASSVFPCDEGEFLTGPDHRCERTRLALSTAIEMLSASECAALATRLSTLGEQLADWRPGRDFELAYGCRGGVHLALMREPTADALADIETIARFRAGFARMHCSLRVRDGMVRELDTPGWLAPVMLPLRDELKASLAARDDEAAIVTLDPFATGRCNARRMTASCR